MSNLLSGPNARPRGGIYQRSCTYISNLTPPLTHSLNIHQTPLTNTCYITKMHMCCTTVTGGQNSKCYPHNIFIYIQSTNLYPTHMHRPVTELHRNCQSSIYIILCGPNACPTGGIYQIYCTYISNLTPPWTHSLNIHQTPLTNTCCITKCIIFTYVMHNSDRGSKYHM